jgi:hypothetical protein
MLLGAGSPLHQWFEPSALAKIIAEHQSARVDHGKRLYALAMLGVWASKS